MEQPIIENIDQNQLNPEQKHALDILKNLSVEQLNQLKKLMNLGKPGVIGQDTLNTFVQLCQTRGLDLSDNGVNTFKEQHKLDNTGNLKGVIGLTTANVYFDQVIVKPMPQLTPWQSIGNGVSFQEDKTPSPHSPTANRVFVGYAGWSVQEPWAQTWVNALARASLLDKGFRFFYAVRGPKEANYASREISNSKLLTHLVNLFQVKNCADLVIAAHSSGSFVAHEFLRFLISDTNPTIVNFTGKTTYINLDGGGSGLDKEFTDRLKKTVFAFAFDSKTGSSSTNSLEMQDLAQKHTNSIIRKWNASNSGCNSGAKWCLHDTMINQIPHNPNHYDLEKDYQDFSSNHPVSDFYLDVV